MTHFRTMPCADERSGNPPFQNCVAATGVNIMRAATNGAVPPTDAEVIALRVATGDTSGGEDLRDLQKGILARYKVQTYLAGTWATIAAGLSKDTWYGVVGHYRDLPARMKNPGQADVFHAVAVGPGDKPGWAVLVDPIQKPAPSYIPVTLNEVFTYCQGGGFSSLGIVEYSEATKHGHIRVLPGPTNVYTLSNGVWRKRTGILPRGFSADSTLVKPYVIRGKPQRMTQVTEGARSGQWFNVASWNVKYTEEL